jgi:branched-chain amino acid transport system permease protein
MLQVAPLIEVTVGGVLQGGIYGIIALGLTLIFGVTKLLNVAHGDFLMLSALLSFFLAQTVKVNSFLTLFLTVPLFFGIGMAFDRYLSVLISKTSLEEALRLSIITTMGFSMMIEDMTAFLLGRIGVQSFGVPSLPLPSLQIGSYLSLSLLRLVCLVIVTVIAALLHLLLKYTLFGKMVRATMENKLAAMAVGINVNKVSALGVGLGVGLAALCGFLLGLIQPFTAFAGLPLTIKALTIIILGGMGSFLGAIIGGLILGIAESYTQFFMGAYWPPTVSLIILIIVLIVRPRGLFGQK